MKLLNYKFRILKKTRNEVTLRLFGVERTYSWDDFDKVFEVSDKIYAIFNPYIQLQLFDHSFELQKLNKLLHVTTGLGQLGLKAPLEVTLAIGTYYQVLEEIFPIWSLADRLIFLKHFVAYLNKMVSEAKRQLEIEEKENSPIVEVEVSKEAVQKSGRVIARDVVTPGAHTCMADVKGADELRKAFGL